MNPGDYFITQAGFYHGRGVSQICLPTGYPRGLMGSIHPPRPRLLAHMGWPCHGEYRGHNGQLQ